MAEFLTPAWAEELTILVAGNDAFRGAAGDADLTIRYDVTGGPRGNIAWGLRLHPDGPAVSILDAAAADPAGAGDVTVSMTWEVAISLASGQITMRRAESTGGLGVTGDLATFFRHSAALTCFDQIQAQLPTEFG